MRLSPQSASEGRTESGIRSEVAGIMWSAFEAEVGDIIVMDLQYRLQRVEQLSEDSDHDGERDEGLKGRTQDRDSSDGYARLREVRPLERAPKPRSDTGIHGGFVSVSERSGLSCWVKDSSAFLS